MKMPNEVKNISAIPCFLMIYIPKIKENNSFICTSRECK